MKETAQPELGPAGHHRRLDLELVVSYTLISGVFLSLGLIVVGILIGSLHGQGLSVLDYTLPRLDLYHLTAFEAIRLLHGQLTARDVIDIGVITLMATPFVRVLLSWLFFAFVERNGKYTVITGFVLAVLTIALALRLAG